MCSTEIVVVRAPSVEVDLRCGGAAMVSATEEATAGGSVDPGFDGGTLLGKRYTDGGDLEVLCAKAGEGALSVGEDLLEVKGAKPLPSSD